MLWPISNIPIEHDAHIRMTDARVSSGTWLGRFLDISIRQHTAWLKLLPGQALAFSGRLSELKALQACHRRPPCMSLGLQLPCWAVFSVIEIAYELVLQMIFNKSVDEFQSLQRAERKRERQEGKSLPISFPSRCDAPRFQWLRGRKLLIVYPAGEPRRGVVASWSGHSLGYWWD